MFMVDLLLLYVQKTNSKVSIIFIKALLLHYYEPKKTLTCFTNLFYTKEQFFEILNYILVLIEFAMRTGKIRKILDDEC